MSTPPAVTIVRVALAVNEDGSVSLVSCSDPHDYELAIPAALGGMLVRTDTPEQDPPPPGEDPPP